MIDIDSKFDIDIESSMDFSNSEIPDDRITDIIHKCVKIKVKNGQPKDIDIDFKTLLNITDPTTTNKFKILKSINIERRTVNGQKLFSFFKDLKVIMSYMTEKEISQMLALRVMYEKYHKLTKTEINSITDGAILTFIPFINEFIKHIDQTAITPKCKNRKKDAPQELYFTEDHLIYLVKIIILSKITLIFTDCINKGNKEETKAERAAAKKELAKKIWNSIFLDVDKTINIKNKIHKLINSRYIGTFYNEKRFWNAAEYVNINIYSQANKLYQDFQTDSILMLEFDKNPLSFLDVFLKNTIFYLSKRKFPLEFVLNNFDTQQSTMKSELSTEVKISIYEDILMKKTINSFIKKNIEPLIIDREIIDQFNNNLHKNILHFWLVIPVISKILNISPLYLSTVDKNTFTMLTIFIYYKMIHLKCFNMADLIKSNMKEINTNLRSEDAKQTSTQIAKYLKSDELNNFLNNKLINDNIVDVTKLIANPLICMLLNQYYTFYNDKINVTMNDIIPEYIRFLEYYISI